MRGPQRLARRTGAGSRRDWPALAAFALMLVAAPQLIGGIYPWGFVSIAAMGLVTLGLALLGHPTRGLQLGTLAAAIVGALLWTVVQAIPLPCSLVERMTPEAAAALVRTHLLFDLSPPAWCTLSRDPGATREEIAKGIAIVASFLAAT